MTTETDADLVEMLRAMDPDSVGGMPDDEVIRYIRGVPASWSAEFARLLTWANTRREAAVEIERQCSVEVIATRDAQIARLTEELHAVVAVELARAALEPAAEGGV